MTESELTSDAFDSMYKALWEKENGSEGGDETNSNSDGESADGASSGGTRKLSSTTTRLASAALRMFGL